MNLKNWRIQTMEKLKMHTPDLAIDDKMFVARLQYTVTTGEQEQDWNSDKLKNDAGFIAEKARLILSTVQKAARLLMTLSARSRKERS